MNNLYHYKQKLACERGSTIVEFAIIAPIMVLLTIGILEFTLAFSAYIQLNEAMRESTRAAFIEDPVADISNLELSDAVCQMSGEYLSCGSYAVNSLASWNKIVETAQNKYSSLTEDNIIVTYSPTGIGSSSTTDGSAPIVSVEIKDFTYDFVVIQNLGISSIEFPSFKTSRIISY